MVNLEDRLRDYRIAYHRGASVFATESGGVDGEYWYAVSGTRHPDYNMALVSDGDVGEHARECLERLTAARVPALLMLAGRGLAAAPVLADAGWVTVASMPLMQGRGTAEGSATPPAVPGVHVRTGTAADLPRAREIMCEAFGVDEATAARVYSEEVLASEGVSLLVSGSDDDETPGCVSLVHLHEGIGTNWALATARAVRRRGYTAAMMSRVLREIGEQDAGGCLVGLATAAAEKAHRTLGGEVLEHWQVWSRPRWMLASG